MTERERLNQLEVAVSELLQNQDRTIEEVVQIKRDVAELSAKIRVSKTGRSLLKAGWDRWKTGWSRWEAEWSGWKIGSMT